MDVSQLLHQALEEDRPATLQASLESQRFYVWMNIVYRLKLLYLLRTRWSLKFLFWWHFGLLELQLLPFAVEENWFALSRP